MKLLVNRIFLSWYKFFETRNKEQLLSPITLIVKFCMYHKTRWLTTLTFPRKFNMDVRNIFLGLLLYIFNRFCFHFVSFNIIVLGHVWETWNASNVIFLVPITNWIIYNFFHLSLTCETNLEAVYFLGVTINLTTGKYQRYNKHNNNLLCIILSNHLANTMKIFQVIYLKDIHITLAL